jgi:hypothetical protein
MPCSDDVAKSRWAALRTIQVKAIDTGSSALEYSRLLALAHVLKPPRAFRFVRKGEPK